MPLRPLSTVGSTTTVIDPAWSVNETLLRVPQAVRVFNAVGIDACCGGGDSLVVAAANASISFETLLEMLEEAASSEG